MLKLILDIDVDIHILTMPKKNKSAQMWYIDFTTALIIFILGFFTFIFFINNNLVYNTKNTNVIASNSEKISDILFSEVYVSESSLGLLSNGKISVFALIDAYKQNYSILKNKLGSNYDFKYFLYFLDSNSNASLEGWRNLSVIGYDEKCGVNLDEDSYVYNDSKVIGILYEETSDFISNFNSSIYSDDVDIFSTTNIDIFFDNLDKYSSLVFYDIDTFILNISQKSDIEKYVVDGGTIILGGEILGDIFELNFESKINSIVESEKSQDFNIVFSEVSELVFPNVIELDSFSRISISNPFLLEKFKDINYEEYHYLVNSNTSEIYFLSSVFFNSNSYPTLIYSFYGSGEVYYLNNFFDTIEFNNLLKHLLQKNNLHLCTLDESKLYSNDLKKISKIERINRLKNKLIVLEVISYEK